MTNGSSLKAQISDLFQNLDRAEKTLDSNFLTPHLQDAAKGRFAGLIEIQRKRLVKLASQAKKRVSIEILWGKLAECKKDCNVLFRECLAFLEGALIRSAGMDSGICQIVDALLLELSVRTTIAWGRFTVLAEEEFYNDLADIIRISYPQFNIWQIPIAAHEFGHFVAPRISDIKGHFPFQEYLTEWKASERGHIKELFSDLFAVYTLGPAYAYACIILRFNPRDEIVNKDGVSHPSHINRVYFMLKGLENSKGYKLILNRLRTAWQSNLADVNLKPEPTAADKILLDKVFQRQLAILDNIPQSQYKGWQKVDKLASKLSLKEVKANEFEGEVQLVDVLNAAWVARLLSNDERQIKEINNRAIKLCMDIVDSKATGKA